MASSNKALNDKIRAYYLGKVKEFFTEVGEEVLVTGSGEICMPCVDAEGNEKWVQFVVKVPTGTHDGEPFDGYSLAEDYEMKLTEKAEKAKEAARKKAEKIKKDAASRAAKAAAREKAKAEREEKEKAT